MANTTINFPRVSALGGDYNFTYLAALATTLVKSGQGLLHIINITVAGDTASTVTVYDNTAASGTVISVLDGSKVNSYHYDAEFSTGLTVVVAGTTSPKLTITWL